MNRLWYWNVMGEILGPFSPRELKELASQRKLSPDCLIRQGERGKWMTASRFHQLWNPNPEGNEADSVRREANPPSIATEKVNGTITEQRTANFSGSRNRFWLAPVALLAGCAIIGAIGFWLLAPASSLKKGEGVLKHALDAWILGDYGVRTSSNIPFYDDDRVLRKAKLMKYEIVTGMAESKELSKFSVILVFQSTARHELKQSRTYSVKSVDAEWCILQDDATSGLRDWLGTLKSDAEQGKYQQEGKHAQRALDTGAYRPYSDPKIEQIRLNQAVILGVRFTLLEYVRLIEEEQVRLRKAFEHEKNTAIAEILQIVLKVLDDEARVHMQAYEASNRNRN